MSWQDVPTWLLTIGAVASTFSTVASTLATWQSRRTHALSTEIKKQTTGMTHRLEAFARAAGHDEGVTAGIAGEKTAEAPRQAAAKP